MTVFVIIPIAVFLIVWITYEFRHPAQEETYHYVNEEGRLERGTRMIITKKPLSYSS